LPNRFSNAIIFNGGYLYPLGYFIAHGPKRTDFSVVDFAPEPGAQQEKVVLAVYV